MDKYFHITMYLNSQFFTYPYFEAVVFEYLRKRMLNLGLYRDCIILYLLQTKFIPDENTSEFWDNMLLSIGDVSPTKSWRHNLIIKYLHNKGNLLNVGVGLGELEKLIFKKFPSINYFGTDITINTINLLKKTYPNRNFFRQRPDDLKFKNNFFDFLIISEVIEHIQPRIVFKVLSEINRVMKKNGKLIITIPVNEGLELMLPYNPNSHVRIYSENLIKFELIISGFKIISVEQSPAFRNLAFVKRIVNSIIPIKQSNNIVILAQKK